ncbi:hypothetical protein TNCV_1754851 [Trichonephila clavipes]|nr:hypothetical protein TNCV_1754851 [Trichonephila clavipes]
MRVGQERTGQHYALCHLVESLRELEGWAQPPVLRTKSWPLRLLAALTRGVRAPSIFFIPNRCPHNHTKCIAHTTISRNSRSCAFSSVFLDVDKPMMMMHEEPD